MADDGFGFTLDAPQVRVLGCLVEKESTTPGSYPLSTNALRLACNQATSRDPVVDYDERTVESTLLGLRDLRLARPVRESGARVTKFRHAVDEVVDLDRAELAVLSVLMLRGPQTFGEVRTRTTRQHPFASVDEVATTMQALASRGFVVELARAAGHKETRWTHLLEGTPALGSMASADTADGSGGDTGGRAVVAVWLAAAEAVVTALADPALELWWDEPSVLEDQAVGGLAGHTARGLWQVQDYLEGEPAVGPVDLGSAGEYFAVVMDRADAAMHQGVRERGASVAAMGAQEVAATARRRLDELRPVLANADLGRGMAVFGGLTVSLGDYLGTRVVEMVVHLDDLDRSVEDLQVVLPQEAVDVALAVGLEVLRRRRGRTAALRALFRDGFHDVLPAM